MSEYVKIYFYKILNWLANPFLAWKGRKNGIEDVANQFLNQARKVTPRNEFYHSFEKMNVSYDLFNGIFFKSDKYNSNVLSIVNNTTPDMSIDVHHFEMSYIPALSQFWNTIMKNCSSTQRWSVYYDNKKITHILCQLTVVPYKFDSKKSHHIIKMDMFFDADFKLISIFRNHFKQIDCPKADITYSDKPSIVHESSGIIDMDLELLLVKLAITSDDSPLIELFPEYFNHIPFDYGSEDFQQRFDLYLMMSY